MVSDRLGRRSENTLQQEEFLGRLIIFLPEYQEYLFRSECVMFLWWQLPAGLLVSTKTITDPVANVWINFHIA